MADTSKYTPMMQHYLQIKKENLGVRQLKIHKSSKSDLIVAFFMSTP